MTSGKQGNGMAVSEDWHLVISLVKDLLQLEQQANREAWSIQQTIAAQKNIIHKTIDELFPGQATLWFVEEEINRSVGRSLRPAENVLIKDQSDLSLSPLIQASLVEKKTLYGLPGLSKDDWVISSHPPRKGCFSIAVPLLTQKTGDRKDTVIGVCKISREDFSELLPVKIEILQAIIAQASQALQNSFRITNERWRQEQIFLVNQVSAKLADIRDLDELCKRVTQLIQKTFEYYYVAILTVETGQDNLRFRSSIKSTMEGEANSIANQSSPAFLISIGEGIVGTVAKTGIEILANDVRQEKRFRHEEILRETQSEVALPLIVKDRILGVLDVQSDRLDAFDDTDMLVLQTLAGNIAVAIEGIQLFIAEKQKANQLSAIHDVSNKIASILDLEELLDEVVGLIQLRFGYPHVHIFSVHSGRRKIFFEAGTETASQNLRGRHFACDLDDEMGIIPWVARHMLTKLVGDVLQEPLYTPKIMGHEGIQSELTVPLVFGGEVLGILDVQSEQKEAFGEQDRFLLEALADNIAVAMRNAYLYRSESWRRQVSDSLREVAGLLPGDVDLEKLLDIILLELERNLPLDLAAIWLVNENELPGENDLEGLYLAAFRGACTQELDLDIGFSPQEILVYNPTETSKLADQDANEWLRNALVSDKPVIRSSTSPFDPLGAALDFEHSYSAIAAPLHAGDQPLGVLMLAHHTSGRYGSESRTMTAAFASYAAVAIKNMRLYEAIHEQAWVSTVLLQVAEATQSQTNLNELLSTVIRITPMLVGVRSCLLYLFDDDEMFVPAVASGLESEQQAEFERWRFAPGDVHAFDQLLVERHTIIIGNDLGNQRLFSIFDPDALSEDDVDIGLMVLVPLLTRDQVLGAFLVDYSEEILIGVGRKPIEELFDEQLAIIQGIAQQTAVAVDNIRLLKSQKEEAYTSVALLQVAQAVVSSNDLDEALSAIVRVTPILVGVKRTAVFLWNKSRTSFILSQSYGLQRELEAFEFPLGEFPLLDAVKLEDRLLLCPLSVEGANSEDTLNYWSTLSVPDSDDIENLLENNPYLLLALPLSVKGNVLGVFLVEEPEPVPIVNNAGGNANRRLRDKRLEIVTGISQQAALAIQNDHYQSEMLERERLEREMQLARQIQTTFLPHETTQISGWDFQATWEPAREVGGDFYDFFELPGNRLGFVIADVADKGLPAAMYMTLARTLVRASVSQVISPGKVLDRVNDYLVLDAPQGMFVTLVYVVLSLETGDLVVANAGHNPPFILRPSLDRIDRLKRGGMALGVMRGDRIQEQRTLLKSGEFLILYTDGVTEAFSPDGDMYTEGRLHQTILEFNKQTIVDGNQKGNLAGDILSGIKDSVKRFTGNQPLSDDLTLLVIKRL